MTHNGIGRSISTLLIISLVAVSTVIWHSPDARQGTVGAPGPDVPVQGTVRQQPNGQRALAAPPAVEAAEEENEPTGGRAGAERSPTAAPRPKTPAKRPAPVKPPADTKATRVRSTTSASVQSAAQQVAEARPAATTPRRSVSATPKTNHCWDFRWQQDAQRAYAANLKDPWGLDGPPGSRNDDGIACRDLPVHRKRPVSEPAGAHVVPLPSTPSMEELLRPSKRYYGVFTRQAPFVMSEVDQLADATGKMPSSVTFFAGWDQPFRPDAVTNAWRRGMLPIVSWESRPIVTSFEEGSDNAVDRRYKLSSIIAGDYDGYLDKWAADVKKLGLPIGLRLDHEMNGFWYPWSEQANGNEPGEYARAWRHVHDRFEAAGATNVIWIWSPNVIGALKDVSLPELYPGSDYVDWLGLGGYYRKPIPGKPATFDNTFGESLDALRAVDDKPILLSEIGCTETGGNKAAWISSTLKEVLDDPDIVGFSWFNQVITATPIGQKLPVTNDWRIDSTPKALAAFRKGIADPGYGSGTSPDSSKS